MFENHSKCPIFDFSTLVFSTNFCPIKSDMFDRKLQVFKNSPKLTNVGILNQLLATQNVNVARFARNFECDFFSDFQTLCLGEIEV